MRSRILNYFIIICIEVYFVPYIRYAPFINSDELTKKFFTNSFVYFLTTESVAVACLQFSPTRYF